MPRGLSHSKYFKASEFYNFILFYSLPTLDGYLPIKYFQHWMLFVKAIFILLKADIKKSEIDEAQHLLNLFVKQIDRLYNDRQMTYNVH